MLNKEMLSIKLITILLVQKMILTYLCILVINLVGVKKYSHSTDIQLMIIKPQEPLKTLWVVDLYAKIHYFIKYLWFNLLIKYFTLLINKINLLISTYKNIKKYKNYQKYSFGSFCTYYLIEIVFSIGYVCFSLILFWV